MNNPGADQPGVRRSLFWRLWFRSLTVKRPQAALAVGSVLVGAAVASMLLNLYGDVRRKMTQEFRAYGPNVFLAPRIDSKTGMPAAFTPNRVGSAEAVSGLMDERIVDRVTSIAQDGTGFTAVPLL